MKNPARIHFGRIFDVVCRVLVIVLVPLFPPQVMADISADLHLERFEKALTLTPDIDKGREKYILCVTCHGPEAWGTTNGSYPQIAGQLRTVTIKQMGDIYSRKRGNPIMEAFASNKVLDSAQDIADLAGYIAKLPMTNNNGRGNNQDLDAGRYIYQHNCKKCHGEKGEGHLDDHIPRLQGQHYNYLMRQFSWIRGGHRKNADKKMIKQIQNLSLKEQSAVMSYVANLQPPAELLAKPGWINPDFPDYDRRWLPSPPRKKPLNK